nr:ABC transporter permease [Salsipaludibacter albus]
MRAIVTMTGSDLRQRVRDRSVLVFGLAVPFALMVVFNLLFSGVGSTEDFEATTIAMTGTADQLGSALQVTFESMSVLPATVDPASSADEARTAVVEERADVAILVPEDFSTQVQGGGSPEVEVVRSGDGSLEEDVVIAVTDGFVDRVATASRAAAAGGSVGLDSSAVSALAGEVAQADQLVTTSPGRVADEQLSLQGSLVAGQTALFMFFTVGFGVIGYLQERDTGTLPRLQSMPMHPRDIIVAKTLVSFVLGLVSTSILLTAGSLLFDVDFGSVVPIAVLVVATVAAATSLVLVVTKVARTAEQASTINAILGIALGVLGGAFFPIGGGGWLSRLSDLTPPAAFIRGLGITSAGGGVTDLAEPLATVAGFLVVAVVLALVLPARQVEA